MDVVDKLANLPVNPDCISSGGMNCRPLVPQQAEILTITILTKPRERGPVWSDGHAETQGREDTAMSRPIVRSCTSALSHKS